MSCSVRMDSRAVCVWTAKKQKRKYISGIAAMTAGQILVLYSITAADSCNHYNILLCWSKQHTHAVLATQTEQRVSTEHTAATGQLTLKGTSWGTQ